MENYQASENVFIFNVVYTHQGARKFLEQGVWITKTHREKRGVSSEDSSPILLGITKLKNMLLSDEILPPHPMMQSHWGLLLQWGWSGCETCIACAGLGNFLVTSASLSTILLLLCLVSSFAITWAHEKFMFQHTRTDTEPLGLCLC